MKSCTALSAPPTGNQPVAAANQSASSASKISEMESPTNATSELPRSIQESRFTAANIPSGIAITHAMTSAVNDNKNVFHRRETISDVAGILYAIEYPKLPLKIFFSQKTYW